jgi:AbrB family looped-hinge helix DNA binding protein
MVLPKEVRERAGLRPGDRLAVITWEEGGKIRVVCLTKADELSGSALNLIAPLMRTP